MIIINGSFFVIESNEMCKYNIIKQKDNDNRISIDRMDHGENFHSAWKIFFENENVDLTMIHELHHLFLISQFFVFMYEDKKIFYHNIVGQQHYKHFQLEADVDFVSDGKNYKDGYLFFIPAQSDGVLVHNMKAIFTELNEKGRFFCCAG